MEKVNLYIGTCMGDLNKKSVYSFDGNRSTKMHINHSEKTFQAAEEASLKGDEERSYILYMRYIDIFQKVRNSQAYRKDESHYSLLLGTIKLRDAVSKAEKLSDSLKERFHKLKQSESLNNAGVKSSVKTNVLSDSGEKDAEVNESDTVLATSDPPHHISVNARSISCEKLYELLFSKRGKGCKILVIDIRSQDEFTSSRIRSSDCINIPKSLIKPGITCKRIEDGIDEENHLQLWKIRCEMDIVVLLSWNSSIKDLDDLSNPLRSLFDALVKWEQELFLKRTPLILTGGFSDWIDYYPQFSTSRNVKRPAHQYSTGKGLFGLSDFNFPDLIGAADDNLQSEFPGPVSKSETLPILDQLNYAQGIGGMSGAPDESETIEPYRSDALEDQTSDVLKTSSEKLQNGSTGLATTSKESLESTIPPVDRTTKPMLQSPTEVAPHYKPESISLGEALTSDTDRAIAEIQSRLQKSIKRKELEEIKANDLQEKKKLIDLQVLEQRMKIEADQEVQRRMAAEKDLVKAMRALKGDKAKKDLLPKDTDTSVSALTSPANGVPKDGISSKEAVSLRETHTVEAVSQMDIVNEDPDSKVSQLEYAPLSKDTSSQVQDNGSLTPSEVSNEDLSRSRKAYPHRNYRKVVQTKDESVNNVDSQRFSGASVAALPLNWEKRLDKRTGRYYYLDHNSKTTHWMLPQSVMTKRKRDIKIPGGSSNLKRSSSSPNIAQLVEKESNSLSPEKPAMPSRQVKPNLRDDYEDPPDVYASKLAQLHPAYGGGGAGLCGLQNLGNTCYMNSVLQCMFNTSLLVQYFLSNKYIRDINRCNFLGSGGEITDGFAVLIKAVWDGRFKHLMPRSFRRTISKFNSRFSGYSQQDSQELLLFLMDGLHEDLNLVRDRTYEEEKDNDGLEDCDAASYAWEYHKRLNKSIIVELFQGQFKATVQCTYCKKISRKFDVFMYLSLPLPVQNCSITECIKSFSKAEKLSGDNKWRCPSCKTEREAVRKMEIWKLPPVLLIHFKRFSFCGRWGDKLQTAVKFPSRNFDLDEYVKGPGTRTVYQLYSVSHHYGTSLDSGHYVASCKSPLDGNWYKFDDHEVSKASVPQGSSAYILCYTSLSHSLNIVKA